MKKDTLYHLEKEYEKKTDSGYRKVLGQFFTPYPIARFMAEWILQQEKQDLEILDPAGGFGVFERALIDLNKDTKEIFFDVWEIDPIISQTLKKELTEITKKICVNTADFLLGDWDKKYDGIIANPPYFKHHHIKNKSEIHRKMCSKTWSKFSIQTNIYCWFLIKSINLLKDGGRLAFIIPSEFLNSNYGEEVKEYIKKSGVVLHLINVNFEENVFDGAITTSIIILAEKSIAKKEFVNFFTLEKVSDLGSLSLFLKNHHKITRNTQELEASVKWRNYFSHKSNETQENLITFSAYGRFSRGIATGSNDFFTLSRDEAKKNNLDEKCLLPCVTKSAQIKSILFTDADFSVLEDSNKKVFLFDGERSNGGGSKKYIEKGTKEGIDKLYLTSKRNPWYALEKREISKIWVSVFGRSGLKFIWNKSRCLNLSCFHAFTPTILGEKYINILFIYLYSDLAKKLFDREKREYGNGLEKFEPNDLNKSKVLDFNLVNRNDIDKLSDLQQKFISGTEQEMKKAKIEADKIFNNLAPEI